jgi:hypothetical protein
MPLSIRMNRRKHLANSTRVDSVRGVISVDFCIQVSFSQMKFELLKNYLKISFNNNQNFFYTGAPISSSYKPVTTTNPQSSYQRTNQSVRTFAKPQPYTRQYSNEYENVVEESDSRYDSYETRSNYKDYERKRRLALESAPWNDEDYFEQKNSRVDYQSRNRFDYKSELSTRNQAAANHSNSTSSFSDFSSSEKSFKQREPSPVQRKRKHSDQTSSPNHHHYSSLSKRGKEDSSPNSSFFSDSGEEFESKAAYQDKSSPPKRTRTRSREKLRMDQIDADPIRVKHRTHRRSVERVEREEKKPIKMTFMRKQPNLSSGKGEFESEDEEEDDFDLYGGKDNVVCTKSTKTSDTSASKGVSSREDLLKRLKEIDEAIAKKRSRT